MSHYSIVVIRDEYTDGEPCYVAYYPDLPGCMMAGDTSQEARAELESVLPEWLAFLRDSELVVPTPQSAMRKWEHEDGSVTMMLTIDRANLWGGCE